MSIGGRSWVSTACGGLGLAIWPNMIQPALPSAPHAFYIALLCIPVALCVLPIPTGLMWGFYRRYVNWSVIRALSAVCVSWLVLLAICWSLFGSTLKRWSMSPPIAEITQSPATQDNSEMKLLDRSVDAVRSCWIVYWGYFNERETDQQVLKSEYGGGKSPQKDATEMGLLMRQTENLTGSYIVYRSEFIEVHRALALKVTPPNEDRNLDFQNVGNGGWLSEICDDLSDLTKSYLGRLSGENKVSESVEKDYEARLLAALQRTR